MAQTPTSPKSPPRDAEQFVLPAPSRTSKGVPALILRGGDAPVLPRDAEVLEETGGRLVLLLECLARFHAELKDALGELDGAAQDGSRAALKGKVALGAQILQWAEAVCEELNEEALRAEAGQCRVDTADLLRNLARQMEEGHESVRITVSPGAGLLCWGRPEQLAEVLNLGLELTSLRIGGKGAIAIEVHEKDEYLHHRILGLGEPAPMDEPQATARFADLLQILGATVTPDSLGQHGTGMVIKLPVAGSR